ncbi:DMT family transporter [Neoactinobaculum massilliense]|uniref:DMT family transporter n=1 Tax=Neoactinobaculum massilliense TaxID=2364794 RepID=UPI000F5249FF|nr:SMR family transporter [Neoactinobaculum massilliense]
MPWVILVCSGMFEAIWAMALNRIDGLSRPVPILVFLAALTVSMGGLGWALRSVPVGTGYAVWVGVGAATTVTWAMLSGVETFSAVKVMLIVGIIACVIGLKVAS